MIAIAMGFTTAFKTRQLNWGLEIIANSAYLAYFALWSEFDSTPILHLIFDNDITRKMHRIGTG
jgi:hypothetical protein